MDTIKIGRTHPSVRLEQQELLFLRRLLEGIEAQRRVIAVLQREALVPEAHIAVQRFVVGAAGGEGFATPCRRTAIRPQDNAPAAAQTDRRLSVGPFR